MKIKVLFFGILKDLVDENELILHLEKSCTIELLKKNIFKKYPKLTTYNFTVAVNETYQNDDFLLTNDAIIALIPPVSGG